MFLEAATGMGLAGVLSVGMVVLSSALAVGKLAFRGRGPEPRPGTGVGRDADAGGRVCIWIRGSPRPCIRS